VILYYITGRRQFSGDDRVQRSALLAKIAEAARAGVDYIQLREKDLSSRELEKLAQEAMHIVRQNSACTKLLINSRTDMAIACGADGVHLPSGDLSPAGVKRLWRGAPPFISVACHSERDVELARIDGADLAIFAPVFEKHEAKVAGRDELHKACAPDINVLALGGVTVGNARECIAAGAAGVAGIRLFQENDVSDVVRRLRQD